MLEWQFGREKEKKQQDQILSPREKKRGQQMSKSIGTEITPEA
jgi:hypothetical protein